MKVVYPSQQGYTQRDQPQSIYFTISKEWHQIPTNLMSDMIKWNLLCIRIVLICVPGGYYNFTKFHQNRMKIKKVLIIAR